LRVDLAATCNAKLQTPDGGTDPQSVTDDRPTDHDTVTSVAIAGIADAFSDVDQ